MNTQNQFEKDAQLTTKSKHVAAESPTITRELTDGEIASVAGGAPGTSASLGGATNTIPVLPSKPPGPVTGGLA